MIAADNHGNPMRFAQALYTREALGRSRANGMNTI